MGPTVCSCELFLSYDGAVLYNSMKFGCQSEVLKHRRKIEKGEIKKRGMTGNNRKGKCDVALPQ